ncbi:Eco57I restriction-modification methylase domain-containing protein [Phormidium tenue]|uniref:site-specific DNA-methyltransferase (adenine-specific) n=1 Tax=Phormidium tenue NIES-30 TaxID=549789 RepID=A0A1U7J4W3_9CYAN|nr:TaqI-like C-terminal specificity domain-containing protein [Phormidium tenue]MBD2232544.1 N-6 DNA methylase [Phormidium tenue FACHB-1052]OKH47683.1 hypothetical protein NIES30_11880 [Phormidium tenue NIES-30]
MAIPERFLELVKRFKDNEKIYTSTSYKEAQLRQEFLNPFFESLGWDLDNRQSLPELYKEVIVEDSISVAGSKHKKAPDYCFKIGGIRKFFVEAKKPSVNLEASKDAAYQVRRYGWPAKLPISILTDFQELAVYDCRVMPDKKDKASKARLKYFNFERYVDSWNEIYDLFSKEAVLAGSLDQFIEENGNRGAATVDTAFLKEIEGWREQLATDLSIRNPDLNQRQLNFAVQMTINRIVFLRIAEDRNIEPYEQLKNTTLTTGVYENLCILFRSADYRYNSGLFHFKSEKDRDEHDELTLSLEIGDEPLQRIIQNLYYPDSPYEFSVIPIEILGQVYEQFLGKVIRLTDKHEAIIEDKPEVRKAGGVYYTPPFIVDYIIANTIGKFLEDKTTRQAKLSLRIIDPSCGSGSFLIAAYQYLLNWYLQKYREDPAKDGHKSKTYLGEKGEYFLTPEEKKDILTKNIYGIDIDLQAVETTKLSLCLKLLEDESNETLFKQLDFLHDRALPDLGENIRCGNSLIDEDYYDSVQMHLLNDEEIYRVNAFNWEDNFSKVFKKRGGFNIVIGNPPYGSFLSESEAKYINKAYLYQNYQLDSYLAFLERSLQKMKPNGFWGMIIPNTWLLNLLSERIRIYLFEEKKILFVRHYLFSVFKKVTVNTEVVILENKRSTADHLISISIVDKKKEISYEIPQINWIERKGKPVNVFEHPKFSCIVKKMRSGTILDKNFLVTQGAKPFQIGKGKPKQTREVVNNKPFVSDTQEDSTFRPLLRGSLIQKYKILWNKNYWISFGNWLAEPRYSAKYDALEKIVIRQTGDSLVATLDTSQFIVRDNSYTIVPRDENLSLRFLLGVINSKLLNWFYQKIVNSEEGEALAQVKREHIASLPLKIPRFDILEEKAIYDNIIDLVDQMLLLCKGAETAKTPSEKGVKSQRIKVADKQIDRLVYGLYGLTDEEIAIVEESL